jgi:glutamyl-tRNA reductase
VYIIAVGLNHRSAPVEIRETVAFGGQRLHEALNFLKSKTDVEGSVILSTCNRTEIYAAVTDLEKGLANTFETLAYSFARPVVEINHYLYSYVMSDAIKHLFRVAAGLDSMVLGETEILGQVKEAYNIACKNNSTNNVINTLFQQAITLGKRVRTETKIDQKPVSVSYTAVELIRQKAGLRGRSAIVYGAGKMAELTLKYLSEAAVEPLYIVNRSYEKAVLLAELYGGRALPTDQLYDTLKEIDILISCTSAPHYVINPPEIQKTMAFRRCRKLVMVDIAVPRDINPEVGSIEGVELFDIDDLQQVVDQNYNERRKLAAMAESIISQELQDFLKWLSSLFVIPTIVALKEKANQIKNAELNRTLNRLGQINDREKKIINSMINTIINQILHDPIVNLKEYASTHQGHLYAEVLQNLFGLEIEGQKSKKRPLGCTASADLSAGRIVKIGDQSYDC